VSRVGNPAYQEPGKKPGLRRAGGEARAKTQRRKDNVARLSIAAAPQGEPGTKAGPRRAGYGNPAYEEPGMETRPTKGRVWKPGQWASDPASRPRAEIRLH
jgi:hypothetical protein